MTFEVYNKTSQTDIMKVSRIADIQVFHILCRIINVDFEASSYRGPIKKFSMRPKLQSFNCKHYTMHYLGCSSKQVTAWAFQPNSKSWSSLKIYQSHCAIIIVAIYHKLVLYSKLKVLQLYSIFVKSNFINKKQCCNWPINEASIK